jgi:catechol 2,3-dioxygenase-like lactoylglutathione lyase family enzyme
MDGTAGIFTRLDSVRVRVRDIDSARSWYERTLGFTAVHADERERVVIFGLGGTATLTLWQLKPGERLAPAGSAIPFPVFIVEDAHASHDLLHSRDVSVDPVQESSVGRSFSLRDPDGNRMEISELHPTLSPAAGGEGS